MNSVNSTHYYIGYTALAGLWILVAAGVYIAQKNKRNERLAKTHAEGGILVSVLIAYLYISSFLGLFVLGYEQINNKQINNLPENGQTGFNAASRIFLNRWNLSIAGMVLSAEQKVRAAANKVAAQKKRASAGYFTRCCDLGVFEAAIHRSLHGAFLL